MKNPLATIIGVLFILSALLLSGPSMAESLIEPQLIDPAAQALIKSHDGHEMHPEASTDAGHHAAAGKPGLPQLDPTWYPSQIFWLLAVFGTLYFIFSKTVLPQISATLENRHAHIQNDLDSAQKLKDQAEEIHAAYERILAEARGKTSQMFLEAEEAIKMKSSQELETFRLRTQVEIDKTIQRIEKNKKEAMEQMNTIAAEMASEAAKKIVGISTDLDKAKDVVRDLSNKARAA